MKIFREIKLTVVQSAIALFFFSATAIFAGFSQYYWCGKHIEPLRLQQFRGEPQDVLRERVLEELKEYAGTSQSDVLPLLREYENRDIARSIRPLWICNVIRFEADERVIEDISNTIPHGQIRRVSLADAELFDPSSFTFVPPTGDSLSWGVQRIGADRIWTEYGIDGTGVLVAILDSGVDFGAADIADALWTNTGEIPFNGVDDDGNGYIDDWRGWDWTEDDPWPHDERGHGTHVSGTVGGRGVFGYGTGVAPGCVIMPLKILDSNGRGDETEVWEAIQYALDMDARVMNMSIGWRYSSEPDRGTWRATVEAACEAGAVMCIAAGNEGTTAGAPFNLRTPGDVPSAITVGATNYEDERASFSSVGPVAWDTIPGYLDYPYPPGHIKPDIAAPGDSIPSMIIGGDYAYWDGTSMASPHVAGAAALLLQLDSSLVHYDIKSLLEASATDLGPAGKDSAYGAGLLNLPSAFALASGFGWIAGTSVPGAKISTSEYSAWVETDLTGNFSMRLTAGGHIVKADAFEYDADSVWVTILAGETTFVNFPLLAGFPAEIELIARDFDTGNPIPYAVFEFVNWPSESIMAGVSGRIVHTIAETDPTEIRGSKSGYISGSQILHSPTSERYCVYLHRAMDFETDSTISHWGPIDDWEWGTVTPGFGPSARSGAKLWATDLDSSYSDTTDSWLWLGTIDLSGGGERPQLAFYQWFEMEATSRGCWDGGNVKASLPMSVWEIIEPVNGYPVFLDDFNPITGGQPAFSGEHNFKHWHEVRFDLDSWTGSTIDVAAHMGSDNNTTRLGWFIDDVALLPRTLREPIIRHAELSGTAPDIAVVCTVYAVSEAIDPVTVRAHFTNPIHDSTLLSLHGEAAEGHLDWFSVGDTVRAWFSASDISGRPAKYPQGAPDSTIFFVISDSFPIDTTAPNIQLYGNWQYRWEDLDSLIFGFIITEESPWEAAFNWGDVILTDSLSFSGVANETLLVRIPRAGAVSLDWNLSAVDSGGNFAETPLSRTNFAEYFTNDFQTSSQPGAPIDGTSWNWLPDSGWNTALADTALDILPLPLFESNSPTTIVLHGDFYFGPSSGGLLRVISDDWDTILTGPSLLPPTNPYFPGASGITMIGDSAAFAFEPPSANSIYNIEVIAACADTSFWRIDSISFAKTTGIIESKLPLTADIRIYPNPFNSSCRIDFSGQVMGIEIIDITGRTVRNLDFSVGQNSIIWDGRDNGGFSLPTGVYLVRAEGCEIVRKTVYIR